MADTYSFLEVCLATLAGATIGAALVSVMFISYRQRVRLVLSLLRDELDKLVEFTDRNEHF